MYGASTSEQKEATIVSYSEDLFNQAKSKMLSDFKKAITDAEALREAAPDPGGDGAAAVPETLEEKSGISGASQEQAPRAPIGAAVESAVSTDIPVHDGP